MYRLLPMTGGELKGWAAERRKGGKQIWGPRKPTLDIGILIIIVITITIIIIIIIIIITHPTPTNHI